jgi:hypothetical protein
LGQIWDKNRLPQSGFLMGARTNRPHPRGTPHFQMGPINIPFTLISAQTIPLS